jgi:hypothetical protein
LPCAGLHLLETSHERRYSARARGARSDRALQSEYGPGKPTGISDGNWIQTVPGKGWNTLLRLYSPLEPFFTKEWRPSEIDPVL